MSKRIVCAAVSVAAVAAFTVAPAANAAPYVGGCQLSGIATFDNPLPGHPPVGATGVPFTYSFTGSLAGCHSSNSSVTGGNVFAGKNGLAHPIGNGSCVSSTTSGESIVVWNDGGVTVVSYSTIGATAAVALTGSVVAATTETNSAGAPLYTTTESATPVGSSSAGPLAFEANPTDCAGSGVSSAGIAGALALGSAS